MGGRDEFDECEWWRRAIWDRNCANVDDVAHSDARAFWSRKPICGLKRPVDAARARAAKIPNGFLLLT
jgi:hypothetical protein